MNDAGGAAAGYRTFEVAVEGGRLRVGEWGTQGPVVLAAHGITASHIEFLALAEQLGGRVRLIAPDLRGRGGSRGIAGPFGMRAHAADMIAVLDHLGIARADVVLGHSMGGFVAAVLGAQHRERVGAVVLVDGGLPPMPLLPLHLLPFGWGDALIERLTRKLIGPSLTRLEMTFASREAYREFWRPHPSLRNDWSRHVEAYLDYDLVGAAPELRASTSKEAVLQDVRTQLFENLVPRALAALPGPVVFLRAPRGILDDKPLYAPARVARLGRGIRGFAAQDVPDTNHFTILLSERGARAVAQVVQALLAPETTAPRQRAA